MRVEKVSSILIIVMAVSFILGACVPATDPSSLLSGGLFLDPDGSQPAGKYDARAVFYYIVTLDQPHPDSVLQASWVAVETNRADANYVIKIDEVTPIPDEVVFTLENEGNFWPTGQYRVYLYLDGVEIQTIDFEVFHDYFSE